MSYCEKNKVIIRECLRIEDLTDLMQRSVAAIRIPDYYTRAICSKLEERLVRSDHYGYYVNAPDIARVGQAFFESQASEKSKKRYNENSVRWLKEIREAADPYLTPIDKLRLELDELWPPGAKLGTLQGTKMFAGLARHFCEGAEAEPHTDVLAWDAPELPDALRISGQIACNTYLSVPEVGGDLLLWDIWPTKSEYEELRKQGSYGLDRSRLPDSVVRIKPRVGELILFHPQRVHAVERIEEGARLTWSNFVGWENMDAPLYLWS